MLRNDQIIKPWISFSSNEKEHFHRIQKSPKKVRKIHLITVHVFFFLMLPFNFSLKRATEGPFKKKL